MTEYSIGRERWSQLNILDQMANLGSEVHRCFRARQRNDVVGFEHALERMLDLVDAITEGLVSASSSYRLRELLRVKEQVLGVLFSDDTSDQAGLDDYFLHYAIAARNTRELRTATR